MNDNNDELSDTFKIDITDDDEILNYDNIINEYIKSIQSVMLPSIFHFSISF